MKPDQVNTIFETEKHGIESNQYGINLNHQAEKGFLVTRNKLKKFQMVPKF